MPPREKVVQEEELEGIYFPNKNSEIEFFSSGCCVLDCVLGGGWALSRISNIVGDKATSKTLLAIEASANFIKQFPNGVVYYRESESAFQPSYAQALGMPINKVDFGERGSFATAEDFYEDLEIQIKKHIKSRTPVLYIVDSLDALSSRSELERNIDTKSYGTDKATVLSQLFRRTAQGIEMSRMHLMIISQIRDNIGVTFGRKYTRSGGHSLDFYASQVIYLAKIKNITETKKGIERATGIRVKAKCDKNKIVPPFREATFDVRFYYGVDDLESSIGWLSEVKRLDVLNIDVNAKAAASRYLKQVESMSDEDYFSTIDDINKSVKKVWLDVERSFLPTRKKYG